MHHESSGALMAFEKDASKTDLTNDGVCLKNTVVPARKTGASKPKAVCLIPFADVDDVKNEGQLHSAFLRGLILACVDGIPADFPRRGGPKGDRRLVVSSLSMYTAHDSEWPRAPHAPLRLAPRRARLDQEKRVPTTHGKNEYAKRMTH